MDPTSPASRAKHVRGLAARHPNSVRLWLHQHPANVLLMLGLPHDRRALDAAILSGAPGDLAPTAAVVLAVWRAMADPEVYTKHGIPAPTAARPPVQPKESALVRDRRRRARKSARRGSRLARAAAKSR